MSLTLRFFPLSSFIHWEALSPIDLTFENWENSKMRRPWRPYRGSCPSLSPSLSPVGVHGPSAQNPWIFERHHSFTTAPTGRWSDGRASNGLSPVSPGHSQADQETPTPSDLKKNGERSRKIEKIRNLWKKMWYEKIVKKMQFRFSAGFRLWWRLFLNNLPQTHCKGTGGETLRPSQNADCQNWRATKRTVPKSSSAAATDRYLARAAQDPTSHNFRNAMSFIPSIPKAKETWKQFTPVVMWYIVMFFSLLVRWYICCWTMSHPFSFFFLA